MRETQRSYDAKCYELAEHFLDDYELTREERAGIADEIASKVQECVEHELSAFVLLPRASKEERNARAVNFAVNFHKGGGVR